MTTTFSNVQNATDSDVNPNILAYILLGVSFEYHDTNVSSLLTLVNNCTLKPHDTGREHTTCSDF